MTATHKGQVTVRLAVKVSWWVRPYLWTAAMFVQTVPFLELDDDRIEGFIARQAAFVAKHGVRYYCNGKRV